MTAPRRFYQVLLLGAPTPAQTATFRKTLQAHVAFFELHLDIEIVLAPAIDLDFDPTLSTAAVFFSAPGTVLPEHGKLVECGIPVVPLVSDLKSVSAQLPECLKPINALALEASDAELVRPVSAVLQCLGLLPSQRRVFISYRQAESRDAAVQLFESLSARHFDVFLDTHSISPAEDFQKTLWHRMCDADVVVMLDTPGYFDSRWTRGEFARANDKQIVMLQVVWPGHAASKFARLATPLPLTPSDMDGTRFVPDVLDRIALEVEALRSKGTAIRYNYLAGLLHKAMEDTGGTLQGMGPGRSIALKLASGATVLAYPTIGVPTALHVHGAVEPCRGKDPRPALLVYDDAGISEQWKSHLSWLGTAVPTVRWIRSRYSTEDISELEEA